jgi:FMN-dependent NADH-azoreductase
LAAYDFLKPYLMLLLNFLGIQEVKFFSVEATTQDETTVALNINKAKAEIVGVVSSA